jgi:general stress protein 26
MANSSDRNEQIQKLRELVKDIKIGMLTTVDADGTMYSRPMGINREIDADGTLWFFTYASSHKVAEVEQHHQVNVSFSEPSKQQYVSISGQCKLVRDRSLIQELWKPQLQAWFPKGIDEPDIALLKVDIEKAEYWDTPNSFIAHSIGLVKAIATGEKPSAGENEKLTLK